MGSQRRRKRRANDGPLKPRGKPFTGRDDPRNSQNMQALLRDAPPLGNAAEVQLVPGEFEWTLYDGMRHVLSRPKGEDRTEVQRDCRRWKEQNISAFMGKYADLEQAFAKRMAGGVDEEEVDEGEERCLALLDEALATWNKVTDADVEMMARAGYEKYEAAGGSPQAKFAELAPDLQDRWRAAVKEVVAKWEGRMRGNAGAGR